MEDLNKQQIILLTLLISFVTSIATGIMTTSLLQEAPVEITRNINRIVEKTIETVTPAVTTSQTKTKETTTVIVKEEDSVVDSINKNINSVVRIKEKNATLGINDFYGIGLVISKDGTILANRKTISRDSTYTALMADNKEFTLTPVGVDKNTNIILFKAQTPDKSPYVFTPAVFADAEPKLGQTLIGIGGDETNSVSVGRASLLLTKDLTVGTTTTKYLNGISADISLKEIVQGSPLLNLSGDVVGFNVSSDSFKYFTYIGVIKKEINTILETPKTPQP
ncbi:MAG: S1C family serine protease [Nitrospira sp.]